MAVELHGDLPLTRLGGAGDCRQAGGELELQVALAAGDQAEARLGPRRSVGGAAGHAARRHGLGIEALEGLPEVGRTAEVDALRTDGVMFQQARLDLVAHRVTGVLERRADRLDQLDVEVVPAPAVLQQQAMGRGEVALQGGGQDRRTRRAAGRQQVAHGPGDGGVGGQGPATPTLQVTRLVTGGRQPVGAVDRGAEPSHGLDRRLDARSGIAELDRRAALFEDLRGQRRHRYLDALGAQVAVVEEETAAGKG